MNSLFKYISFYKNVFKTRLRFYIMDVDNTPEFEIGDVENFSSSKDEQFSHSTLVMSAMKKCLEAGCKEMKTGWFNVKQDRQGNTIKTYVDDSRKNFIESIKTCCMVMACDLDKEAEEYIDECLEEIKIKKKELAQLEEESYNKLNEGLKTLMKSKGIYNIPGHISHPELKEHLVWFELEMFRSIYAELSKLTQRLGFYKEEMFTV